MPTKILRKHNSLKNCNFTHAHKKYIKETNTIHLKFANLNIPTKKLLKKRVKNRFWGFRKGIKKSEIWE